MNSLKKSENMTMSRFKGYCKKSEVCSARGKLLKRLEIACK